MDAVWEGDPGSFKSAQVCITATRSGLVSALAYWFEIDLGHGHAIETGPTGGVRTPQGDSTGDPRPPHWRQALAILPGGGIQVNKGDTISTTVECAGSSICFSETHLVSS